MLNPFGATVRAGIAVHAPPSDEVSTALASSGVSINIVPGLVNPFTGSPVGSYVISRRYALPFRREPVGTAAECFGANGVIVTVTEVVPARGATAPESRSMTNWPSGSPRRPPPDRPRPSRSTA
jgi:hypothetical protein